MMVRYYGFMLIASKVGAVSDDTWINESGASSCMTYNKNWFIEMKEDARIIKICDGSKIPIQQSEEYQGMINDKTGNPR
jgi:hypothetical protein